MFRFRIADVGLDMAIMHTKLRGTESESVTRIFLLFEKKLTGDYHVWHDFIEPKNQISIDFAVLNPKYGMWAIEMKDWLIRQVRHIDAENCRVVIKGKEIKQLNPVREARENHYPIRNLLMAEPTLLHQQGKFEGNLIFPVHHLILFSKISKDEMIRKDIYQFFPEHQIITAEAVRDANLTEIALENLLIEKRSPRFLNHHGLTDAQIDAIDRIFNPAANLSEPTTSESLEESPAEAIDPDEGITESESFVTDDILLEKTEDAVSDALVLNDADAPAPVTAADEISTPHLENEGEQRVDEPAAEREILMTSGELAADNAGEISGEETVETQPHQQIDASFTEPRDQAAATNLLQTGQNAPTELQKSLMTILALNQQLLQKMWSKG